ncbi:DUF72 domain-containing protein [Corticibacterium sp. UT-5YL-CI-8]|nr:DUF72 domain-containing protein [Tianweitania sp. UT-5YL-CI-8]
MARENHKSPERAVQDGGGGKAGRLHLGTSGWHYADWWGVFYPDGVKKKDALSYYSNRFDTVELNAPFYRMPTEKAVRNWAGAVPEGFLFAWKAWRYFTHLKRLPVDETSVQLMESRMALLGEKAGPVLFQLHPGMKVDPERLAVFLSSLPRNRRYSIEFRHESWYEPAVFRLLEDHGCALCISDHAHAPSPRELTADWTYIRNHGPSGNYRGHYTDEALKDWARWIDQRRKEGIETFMFFDNTMKSAAPKDIERLQSFLAPS